MAGLGIKLTPEETADAFKGLKLSPDEMTSSKYPQPRSMTANDEDLGLATGPISSARVPGTSLSVPLRADMSEIEGEHLNDQAIDAVQRLENTAGAAAAGGAAGALARGATVATPSTSMGINALARVPTAAAAVPKAGNALQTAILGALLGQGMGTSGSLAGGVIGLLTPTALRALGHAPAAATAMLPPLGAAAAGGAAMNAQDEPPDEALRKVARMLMGGNPLGQSPTFPQGE